MQTLSPPRQSGGLILLGTALVIAGIGTIALRAVGIDPIERISDAGWPLFVILPGLLLLGAALVPVPPQGIGYAIAGSIVTTIGLVLLYQAATGHWESWAYAWALIPAGAGLGLLLYGLLFRQGDMVRQGARMVTIAAAFFAIGFWFFETLFESGRVPADLQNWWPLGLMVLGVLIVLGSLVVGVRQGPAGTESTVQGG